MSDKDLAPNFFGSSGARQEDIEQEIDRKSVEIANDLVAELKKHGFIEKEPNKEVLSQLVKTVMKRHGAAK
jgi:ribosomal protein S19E (S16A)